MSSGALVLASSKSQEKEAAVRLGIQQMLYLVAL